MMATLAVAWRTVIKRLVADWLVVVAVFVTVVLATALLAAGPIYADAVTISALQRSLAEAPVSTANIAAEVKVFPEDLATADEVTRTVLTDALTTTGADIFTHLEADAYGLESGSGQTDTTDLASIEHFEDIEAKASLIEGTWSGADGVGAAITVVSAETLGLAIGDTVTVVNRLDLDHTVDVEIVGIFSPDDLGDPYWFEDPLISQGAVTSGSFRIYGPFVVGLEAINDVFTTTRVNAGWRALPHFDELAVSEVETLRASTTGLEQRLDTALTAELGEESGTSGYSVTTGLPTLLEDVDSSLTVTRSSVVALLVQLAILAGYALVLVSTLLADTRRTETILLRSRGSSPRQLATTALFEALLIAVPAALISPFVATFLLKGLNLIGPLAAIGLTIEPVATVQGFTLAAVAALLAVVVIVWPSYRSALAFGSNRNPRLEETKSVSQRIGIDLVLLALAALAFWQLRELGPDISTRVRGQFGVDPLLVVAPALGLLAGAVLALRVIPLLAIGADRLASAGGSVAPALASWQIARRPRRYSRAALLLVLAISIGFFAASYSTTWAISQRDQAAYLVGADVAVNVSGGRAGLPSLYLQQAHLAIDGVEQTTSLNRNVGSLTAGGGQGQFLFLDAATAPEVVALRSDLAPSFHELMARLVEARPNLATTPLPGTPDRLLLDMEATETIPPEDDFLPCDFPEDPTDEDFPYSDEPCFQASVSVVVQDGDGFLHRLPVGALPANTGPTRLEVEISEAELTPTYPLSVVAIEIASRLPQLSSRTVEISLTGMSTIAENDETAITTNLSPEDWTVEVADAVHTQTPSSFSVDPASGPGYLRLDLVTGADFLEPVVEYGLRPAGTTLPETYPVVVSSTFPETNLVDVGESVRLPSLRIDNDSVTIAGTIDDFPTSDPRFGELVIVDLATYQMMGFRTGWSLPQPEEYWLTTSGDDAATINQLLAPPLSSLAVTSQEEVADTLLADPVALATIGALAVGFVAAVVFATAGFAVSATVSARERLVEFALFRALGLSRRQLGVWLTLEQGVLVVVSLILGTVVGWIITKAILPLVTLTQSGEPAVPPVMVTVPWDVVAGLLLAVVVVLGLVVLVMTVLLRRIGLGSLLRMGDD